ncbi:MAG: hypothetical protein JWN82_191 [Candidatus Saccharibacteria bacterium]|nr:hypothetical protein [Candidatus Saccharibacteria bacterium]
MSTSNVKPATLSPTSSKGGKKSTPVDLDAARSTAQRQFVNTTLNMMWQLAVVVLVPVVIGAQLDKALDSGHILTYIALALSAVGAVLVMWRAMRIANSLPVPKLSAAQKRAVKKAYDDEDEN